MQAEGDAAPRAEFEMLVRCCRVGYRKNSRPTRPRPGLRARPTHFRLPPPASSQRASSSRSKKSRRPTLTTPGRRPARTWSYKLLRASGSNARTSSTVPRRRRGRSQGRSVLASVMLWPPKAIGPSRGREVRGPGGLLGGGTPGLRRVRCFWSNVSPFVGDGAAAARLRPRGRSAGAALAPMQFSRFPWTLAQTDVCRSVRRIREERRRP